MGPLAEDLLAAVLAVADLDPDPEEAVDSGDGLRLAEEGRCGFLAAESPGGFGLVGPNDGRPDKLDKCDFLGCSFDELSAEVLMSAEDFVGFLVELLPPCCGDLPSVFELSGRSISMLASESKLASSYPSDPSSLSGF